MHKSNWTRVRRHLGKSSVERVFRGIETGEYLLVPASSKPPTQNTPLLKDSEDVVNDTSIYSSSTSPSYDVTSQVSDLLAPATTESFSTMLTTPLKSVVTLTSVRSGGSPMVFNGKEWGEDRNVLHSASSIVSADLDIPGTPRGYRSRKVHFKESATILLGTASSSSAISLPLSIQYEQISTSPQVSCRSPYSIVSENRVDYLEYLCRSQATEISKMRDTQAAEISKLRDSQAAEMSKMMESQMKELAKLREQLNLENNEGRLKMNAIEMALDGQADMLEAHKEHLEDVGFTMTALEERMNLAEEQINVNMDIMEGLDGN